MNIHLKLQNVFTRRCFLNKTNAYGHYHFFRSYDVCRNVDCSTLKMIWRSLLAPCFICRSVANVQKILGYLKAHKEGQRMNERNTCNKMNNFKSFLNLADNLLANNKKVFDFSIETILFLSDGLGIKTCFFFYNSTVS